MELYENFYEILSRLFRGEPVFKLVGSPSPRFFTLLRESVFSLVILLGRFHGIVTLVQKILVTENRQIAKTRKRSGCYRSESKFA